MALFQMGEEVLDNGIVVVVVVGPVVAVVVAWFQMGEEVLDNGSVFVVVVGTVVAAAVVVALFQMGEEMLDAGCESMLTCSADDEGRPVVTKRPFELNAFALCSLESPPDFTCVSGYRLADDGETCERQCLSLVVDLFGGGGVGVVFGVVVVGVGVAGGGVVGGGGFMVLTLRWWLWWWLWWLWWWWWLWWLWWWYRSLSPSSCVPVFRLADVEA